MSGLRVENLSVEFQTEGGMLQAVRDISFSLHPGHTLALVGESGSGKSVTGRAILGILEANARVRQGKILYEGSDLLQFSEAELVALRGSRVAMIFLDPLSSLDPLMRVGRQITEVIRIKCGMGRSAAREKALRLLREVGIPEPERCFSQFPHQLSGGMRQRVVIAIALAADPDILICDEPTTALDVTIQAQILEILQRLKQQRQLSMLFITHDFGVVAEMADDVAVMYAGKIVEYGRVEEIFYQACHPYTRALLRATPDPDSTDRLFAIPGSPPNMLCPPQGDAFAPRNAEAMEIDYRLQPPAFTITPTHWAATWLLHPDAPKGGGHDG